MQRKILNIAFFWFIIKSSSETGRGKEWKQHAKAGSEKRRSKKNGKTGKQPAIKRDNNLTRMATRRKQARKAEVEEVEL